MVRLILSSPIPAQRPSDIDAPAALKCNACPKLRSLGRPRLEDVVSLLDIDQTPESQRYNPWVASGTNCGGSGSIVSVKVTKTTGRATMKASAALRKQADAGDCWSAFRPGDWTTSINVRDFIVRNVTPYAGNEEFLAAPS